MTHYFNKPVSFGQYIRYLIPSILTMIFLSFYTTIDGFFVSRFAGSNALAGINIVIPITCVIFGIAVMLATGAGAIIAARMGQKKTREANQLFSLACIVLVLFSIVFTIAGLLLLEPVCVLLGASETLLPHVLPYAAVTFIATLPMSFKLFFEYLVRTDGSSHVGLIMSIAGLLLNVLLDYLFVGLMDMGTLGAALGTALSISASALVGLTYFLRFGRIRFCKPVWDGKALLKSCTNGSSEMLTELSTGITTFLFNIIVMRYYGEDGVAAVTILMYIYYFFISFYMGIAVATAPVISYNIGTRNAAKIKETLRYSFITIAVTSLLILGISYLLGTSIIAIFTGPGHVFDITWSAMRLFSLLFLFIGVNVFLSSYFTAIGNGFISALISMLRSLILVVIFILVLPLLMGVDGVWLTMPFSELITAVCSLSLFLYAGKQWMLDR